MDIESVRRILDTVERSTVQEAIRLQWLEAATRYAELRVAWWTAAPDERRNLDASRTAAHDAFIDCCNILSRAMAAAGEPNGWRAEIGVERGEIGDFACVLHCVLGLKAR
jgi:hypothetical protein